ncbi:Serine/threonine-protein kinase atg-1 [Gossypium arboreum]|uniref:Serine/threonine-protein kinase atg-1 n=1 Tax=Gossypium arboreum TaxID=29729 RepID=A0A0B0PXU2_GOSAR|nr:Serine/threonine-protein kinase atg-1 [Gossypium arboreum]KHG29692.1 Serine/threonine-protein kinase atg-1 [Gossypium arboreum]
MRASVRPCSEHGIGDVVRASVRPCLGHGIDIETRAGVRPCLGHGIDNSPSCCRQASVEDQGTSEALITLSPEALV